MSQARPGTHRPLRAALPLVLAALLAGGGATAQATTELANLSALQRQYEANYQPGAEVLDAQWQLAVLGRQLAFDALPALTFTQRAAWRAYQQWSLELDLAGTVPLYRSRAEPLAAVHEAQVALLADEAQFRQKEAHGRFHRELLALTLFRFMEPDLSQALENLQVAGWVQPASVAEALPLRPQARELLALELHVRGLHDHVRQRITDIERSLAASLALPGTVPALPRFSVMHELLVPPPTSFDSCIGSSPVLRQGLLHHEVRTLEEQAQRTPDVRLELRAGTSYRNSHVAATVGLQARVALPSAAPVAGSLGATVDPQGAEQTLSLSWPPPDVAGGPRPRTEAEEPLQRERQALESELRALHGAYQAAIDQVEAAEVQLLWTALDVHGHYPPAAAAPHEVLEHARELANTPSHDPFADLELARLRSELGFAQLALAELLIDMSLVCGGA